MEQEHETVNQERETLEQELVAVNSGDFTSSHFVNNNSDNEMDRVMDIVKRRHVSNIDHICIL